MKIDPMNMGALVPTARRSSSPEASPGEIRCPSVLNVKALRPNPAKTSPVALARVVSGNDLATALMAPDNPAAPPHPDRNIAKQRRKRASDDGAADGSVELRMGMTRE